MANVLITGGTGYIGRALIPELMRRGHGVKALTRPGSENKLPPGAAAIAGNPLDSESVRQAIGGSDTLVHLVGVPHPSPAKAAEFISVDLASAKVKALALAETQSVPAGIYAKEWLQSRKLWDRVSARVIPTENVRAALAAVESGNAEAGIVYKTDAGISKKVKIAYEVPAAGGPKISYPLAVIAESKRQEAARKLLAYLESPPALEVFRRYGFLVPASP